jgi:polyisoprenoid-binding protein YceI
MQAPSGQATAPALSALLSGGTLAGKWVLDPGASSVQLKNRSLAGLVQVSGVFREVSGYGTVAADGTVSGTLTIAAASVDTKNSRRDKHLRSADLFEAVTYPDITFTADGIRASGPGVAVTGALTVRGRTGPLSFDAAATVTTAATAATAAVTAATAAMITSGGREIWLDAEVIVDRASFGITWNPLGLVSMNSTIVIHAVFTRR